MKDIDLTIKVGGEAGQGIQTIGYSLARVMTRSGYHVFSCQDYESRVRGGHNVFQMRVADKRVLSSRRAVDLLIALDADSLPFHGPELSSNGSAIYDSASSGSSSDDNRFVDVPFRELARKRGGDEVMANSVAMGAALAMLGAGPKMLIEVLEESLAKKGDEVIRGNREAVRAGWEFASENSRGRDVKLRDAGKTKALIEGSEAIAVAAIGSGCRLYAAYPMTPSTGILNFMASKAKEFGLVVEQAEDEISAINMIIGASYAGVRAMTGTSGGGFSLMVEGVSLAGMTETPVVIALGQRPGPATGLPTRTEQADLLFALHAGHGEFARIIFAPGTPEQAFRLVSKAFDLAEKYQAPAVILTDQLFSDAQWTLEEVDGNEIFYNDHRLRGEELESIEGYRRHEFTESGVSPLAIPGASRHLVVTDSDEHDEEGHITEDAQIRTKMVEKRLLRKVPLIREEISQPLKYGSDNPEILLVGWGSTCGVMKDAVDFLSNRRNIAMLHFSEVYPLPAAKPGFLDILEGPGISVCVENNAEGKFASLLKAETGYEFDMKVNKYDGRPFTLDDLVEKINV